METSRDKKLARLLRSIDKLPDTPGVYIFKGPAPRSEKLYIGKATSLRNRVRSYSRPDIINTRGPLIEKMFHTAARVDFIETNSVLEALILEASLIKKYLPDYNTKEKDNKSFNYVVITREQFPRVLIKRGREIVALPPGEEAKLYREVFGPFPNGASLREAMKIVRRIFPYRDTCTPATEAIAAGKTPRPCFNQSIGLCPGVCTGAITAAEYAKTVRRIALFFEGNMKRLLGSLEKDMATAARREEFEKAAEVRKTIFALQHIQDVSLISRDSVEQEMSSPETFRIEAYDIAHLGGTSTVGAMVVVENGQSRPEEYRRFKIRGSGRVGGAKGNDDVGNLSEVLERRLNHAEWPLPQLIVVDGSLAQRNAAEKILAARNLGGHGAATNPIPVVSVVKDEHHKPRDIEGDQSIIEKHRAGILRANSEAHRYVMRFHKVRRGKDFLGR